MTTDDGNMREASVWRVVDACCAPRTRTATFNHLLLGALSILTLASCSAGDPEGELSSNVRSSRQAIMGGARSLTAANGYTATYSSLSMPASDQYSFTYRIQRDVADNIVLKLYELSGTDPVGQVTIPANSGPATLDVTHSAEFATPGTIGSLINRSLRVEAEVNGGSGGSDIQIQELTIDPLRTTGTVDPNTRSFLSSDNCSFCHESQFRQWRSSMMGYSSISPPIHSLELTENHVGPGTSDRDVDRYSRFARTRDNAALGTVSPPLGAAHAEGQQFCQRCHAPSAAFTDTFRVFADFDHDDDNRGAFPDSHQQLRLIIGADLRTSENEGLFRDDPSAPGKYFDNLPDPSLVIDNALAGTEGVTCTVCHSINGIDAADTQAAMRPGFEAGIANAAFRVVHMEGDGTDPFFFTERVNYGPYKDGDVNPGANHMAAQAGGEDGALRTGTDGLMRPYIRTGEMCGSCHDVRIAQPDLGADGQTQTSLYRAVENLFTEWQTSPWNNDNVAYQPGALGSYDNPSAFATTGAKKAVTCQDCHMSEYMTEEDAKPGQYAMGCVAGDTCSNPRPISNHRFIGVDRFLTYDIPHINESSNTDELVDYDTSNLTQNMIDNDADLEGRGVGEDLREVLLQKAIDFRIEHVGSVVGTGASATLPVRISLENVGAGHNIPAGLSQEREMWIELEVLANGEKHVFTTGYLNPIEDPSEFFQPKGDKRYSETNCADPTFEPRCELDEFQADLGPFLGIEGFSDGADDYLRNYQNGFSKNGSKVFTQFIADHVDNSKSLPPLVKKVEQFDIPVGHLLDNPETAGFVNGPFQVNARLRFRPLPFEFLEALHESAPEAPEPGKPYPSRVSDDIIARNRVIEMESDSCVLAGYQGSSSRPCSVNPQVPISLGEAHGCFVFGDEDLVGRSTQCFGDNQSGQVGIGEDSNVVTSPRVLNLLDTVMTSLGEEHSCALLGDGTVSCWGDGSNGKLADNNPNFHQRTTPQKVDANSLNNVTQIASASNSTCALVLGDSPGEDQVKCWGEGANGQLGIGSSPTSQALPAAISSFWLPDVRSIAAGDDHYCAVAARQGQTESVRCWGHGKGTGRDAGALVPRGLPGGLPSRAKKLAAGNDFTCALVASGDVYCWGVNDSGQLGNDDPSGTDSTTPVKVAFASDEKAIDIAAGRSHACAIMESSFMQCWGDGSYYKLGTGYSDADAFRPQQVRAGTFSGVTAIAAGGNHTCAVTDGTGYFTEAGLWCWGKNESGEVGRGDQNSPVQVPEQVLFEEPSAVGRTYWAPYVKGGPGEAGCSNGNCTDLDDYVDLNANSGFTYEVDSEGGFTDIYLRVSVNNQGQTTRSMNLFVNGSFVQVVEATSTSSPRPNGQEQPAIEVYFVPGVNTVELRDIDGNHDELDVQYIRIGQASPENCFDHVTNQDESDVDCGGVCGGCQEDQMCSEDSDCATNNCEAGICGPGSVGVCDENTATDLGGVGSSTTVPANACVRVRDGYPSDWGNPRPMKLQNMQSNSSYPVPYTWSNVCGGGGGMESFTHNWEEDLLSPVSKDCATIIKFNGSPSGQLSLTYYAN